MSDNPLTECANESSAQLMSSAAPRASLADYSTFPSNFVPHSGPGTQIDPLSRGYVYIIGFDEPGIVKIGSAKCVASRLLGLQGGNPFELKLRAVVSVYDCEPCLVEFATHRLAKKEDCHIRGEWFALNDDEALALVIQAARNKKVKFGSWLSAYNQAMIRPDHEGERRRIMRRKLGID